jgi:hypothetical protein
MASSNGASAAAFGELLRPTRLLGELGGRAVYSDPAWDLGRLPVGFATEGARLALWRTALFGMGEFRTLREVHFNVSFSLERRHQRQAPQVRLGPNADARSITR